MLKMDDLRQLNQDELAEKVADLRKEYSGLRFDAKTGKLEKNHRVNEIKKDIARVLTVKNELLRGASISEKPTVEEVKKKAAAKKAAPEVKKEAKKEEAKPEKKEKSKKGLFGRRKKG